MFGDVNDRLRLKPCSFVFLERIRPVIRIYEVSSQFWVDSDSIHIHKLMSDNFLVAVKM